MNKLGVHLYTLAFIWQLQHTQWIKGKNVFLLYIYIKYMSKYIFIFYDFTWWNLSRIFISKNPLFKKFPFQFLQICSTLSAVFHCVHRLTEVSLTIALRNFINKSFLYLIRSHRATQGKKLNLIGLFYPTCHVHLTLHQPIINILIDTNSFDWENLL